jgi:hypothetical protein
MRTLLLSLLALAVAFVLVGGCQPTRSGIVPGPDGDAFQPSPGAPESGFQGEGGASTLADGSAPPSPDSGPGPTPLDSRAVAACTHLASLGCQDGANPMCATVLSQNFATPVFTFDPSCMSTAKTLSALCSSACGASLACCSTSSKKPIGPRPDDGGHGW